MAHVSSRVWLGDLVNLSNGVTAVVLRTTATGAALLMPMASVREVLAGPAHPACAASVVVEEVDARARVGSIPAHEARLALALVIAEVGGASVRA
jgi:hypothetical protein